MPSAVKPTNVSRVSMLMRTDLLMNSIRTNQVDLLKIQNQLATGLRIARPSEDPAGATSIMHLDSLIERYKQYQSNLSYANDYLSTTDTAVGQAVTLVNRAHEEAVSALAIASDSGSIVDYETYIPVIDGIISQLVSLGNATCRGSYVFAGQNSTQSPFEMSGGGVLFTGNLNDMQTRVSDEILMDFSVTGQEVFGALSSQVQGIADLNPAVTADTLLTDLNGNLDLGIRKSSILISDGSASVTVDISSCVTLGDVINKINTEATAATVDITAAINASADGLVLQAGAAANITVNEIGTGTAARDLGIYLTTGAGVGVDLVGQDVDARLSLTTPVTALAGGAGIDTLSGLVIANGDTSKTIDLSPTVTLGDILNTLNNAGVGIRAEINTERDGINVLNQMSGSRMMIGENGGTTTSDLGIRSMVGSTSLADLNGGAGVATEGETLRITDSAGATYDVDLTGALTVQDVIDLINTAGGGVVTAGLTATGNGIELSDLSGGAGDFSIGTLTQNGYFVAKSLGFYDTSSGADGMSVAAGNPIVGADVNPVEPDGIFSHLIALRTALEQGDSEGVERAGALLEADHAELVKMQGIVGSTMQALQTRMDHMEENMLAAETLRSDIRDIDFTEAVTRYQNLYTALQGNLMTGSQLVNVSLLDFLV
ncbi:MAG: flagellar hook-associated protein FlgL [Sedimentisphaerales bacterium]|nr:flagellar hook-associated protein FlgL [Sedimentisphaerales bacterium]